MSVARGQPFFPACAQRPIDPGSDRLFAARGLVAKHLGIVATDTGTPTLIHMPTQGTVVESSLSRSLIFRIAALS
jgi:hypothetical protein